MEIQAYVIGQEGGSVGKGYKAIELGGNGDGCGMRVM